MKQQSTTKGFAILSAAAMGVKIMSLLYIFILTRILGKEGYGIYAVAYQVFGFVYVLANSGICVAISKFISELTVTHNHRDAVRTFKISRTIMFTVGSIMCILMLLLAPFIAEMSSSPRAAMSIRYLAPCILVTSVLSVYRGYFQGKGNMTPTGVSQIIEQAINIIFSLMFAVIFIKFSLEAACAGATIGTTLGASAAVIYLIFVYKKDRKAKEHFAGNEIAEKRYSKEQLVRKVASYAIPMTICMGLQNGGNLIDTFNINSRLFVAGFGSSEVSILYATLSYFNTLINVPITLISALSAAVLPALSGASALADKKAVNHRINHAFRLCFLVAIPSAVGLSVLSKPIYILLFSNPEGSNLMLYGAGVVILWSVVMIQSTILQSKGELYRATFYLVIGIVLKIITNYILVAKPEFNINGAIIGSIICFSVPFVLNHIFIKKKLGLKFHLIKHSIKPLIAGTFMGIAAYIAYFNFNLLFSYIFNYFTSANVMLKVANALATMLAVLVAAFVYAFALVLIGGINQRDIESASPKMRRLIPKFILSRVR